MFAEHEFFMFIMSTLCLICIKFWWVCDCVHFFCPLWMWGFNPAIYISFFFSLYNAAFSACLNTYSMRYILACWISWSWKCCMECYNKVIFFYKLQLKWFVLFFMGIWWCITDAAAVCTQVCVLISVQFLLFMLAILCSYIALLLLAHGTTMHTLFSWNVPKELVFM